MSTINSLDDNFCSTSIETPPQVGPTDKKVGRVVYMTLLGAGIGQWCAWMASSSSYIPAALGGILGAIYTNPNLPVSETSEEFYCKIGRIFNKAVEGLFEGARFGWIAAVSSDIVCQVPWVVTPPLYSFPLSQAQLPLEPSMERGYPSITSQQLPPQKFPRPPLPR